jgi:predicted acyltransferase
MIMVNNQGSQDDAIWPFHESEWNGITTADMVFPSFLFINGMSIYYGIKPDDPQWYKLIKRVVILFLIGFFFNLQDANFNFLEVRILGVL